MQGLLNTKSNDEINQNIDHTDIDREIIVNNHENIVDELDINDTNNTSEENNSTETDIVKSDIKLNISDNLEKNVEDSLDENIDELEELNEINLEIPSELESVHLKKPTLAY